MDRRTLLRMGGVALAGGVAGCGGSSADDPPDTDAGTGTASSSVVEMTDGLKFQPAELTVAVGETVTWENVGAVAHSVTAYEDDLPDGAAYFASGGFDSEDAARGGYPSEGSLGDGDVYEHTFETAGEFPYFCIPHENGMKGTITVE